MKNMLSSMTPLVTKQAAEIKNYRQQVLDLTQKNQQLMN